MNSLKFAHLFMLLWLRSAEAASCPTVKLMQNFSPDKYLGVWYEIQAEDNIFQTLKSCLESTFTRVSDNQLEVNSNGKDSSGNPATTQSTLNIDPETPAHMVSDFVPGVQPPFDILDTDYETYSCVHSCLSVVGIKTEFLFIYSRNRTLDAKLVEHCRQLFESSGLDTSSLRNTPQDNCSVRSDL